MARLHESLIPLSHEHHDALLLAWRLRTGDLSKREPELRAKHGAVSKLLLTHSRLAADFPP